MSDHEVTYVKFEVIDDKQEDEQYAEHSAPKINGKQHQKTKSLSMKIHFSENSIRCMCLNVLSFVEMSAAKIQNIK